MTHKLENALFQLKFMAKSLNREAATAGKDEQREKIKVEKAMKAGLNDIARIHAQNAVRKQTERLNLLKLASQVDAVAGRVKTASTMRQVTGNMENVVKAMDIAMKSMNLERLSAVMEGFDTNSSNLDVADAFTREMTSEATAVGTPQDDVDRLMNQTADKVGVELNQDLEGATPAKGLIAEDKRQENLGERLRALRN